VLRYGFGATPACYSQLLHMNSNHHYEVLNWTLARRTHGLI
jgi:hypothetical protein